MRIVLIEFPWHVKKILNDRGSFDKDVIVSLDAESSYMLRRNQIKYLLSPKHIPSKMIQVQDIPKTKNGKIVELTVKKIMILIVYLFLSESVFACTCINPPTYCETMQSETSDLLIVGYKITDIYHTKAQLYRGADFARV